MSIIAIEYEYDSAKLDILAENRPAHRTFLRELFDEKRLLASGPLGENGALIVVVADDPDAGLRLLDGDPLLGVGVIESRSARVWNPVIGPWQ
ncbi:hypothetical protein I6E29_03075 [Arcanobacterium haemolyticum]|nr:hypothetical protein [Arcanobacterium haemolyticum]